MPRVIALVLFALAHVNCAAVIALPPTRTDVGTMVVAQDGTLRNGSRVSSGMHWASGTRSRSVPFDIGADVVYEHAAVAANEVPKSATQASAAEHNVGGYIEAASRLSASGVTRSWVGGRAEMLRNLESRETSTSLSARLSWEVYGGGTSGGADGGSGGFAAYAAGGTIGIGPYIEAGVRHVSMGSAELLVTAGVSLRLPAIIAFGVAVR